MKIAGIVVYEPDYGRLIENIQAIYPQVDCVVLYLNSIIEKNRFSSFNAIHYLNDGQNNGIAVALNSIMSYADSLGAEWCLLLDQDSVVSDNCVEKYERHIHLTEAAVLAPCVLDNRDREATEHHESEYSIIDMCITSGSYNSIEKWKKVQGFRDEFFIDYVDWEYCARVKKCGYMVYRINDITINHQLGTKTYYSILGKSVFSYNHSAFRKYYITRNTIVSYKLYPHERKFAHPYLRTFKRLLLVILFEGDKAAKIKSIARGVFDSRELYKKLGEKAS